MGSPEIVIFETEADGRDRLDVLLGGSEGLDVVLTSLPSDLENWARAKEPPGIVLANLSSSKSDSLSLQRTLGRAAVSGARVVLIIPDARFPVEESLAGIAAAILVAPVGPD